MIFVYPALCSQDVDPRIVPAVARALERFYLINLAEAFSNGTIRPKSVWNGSKGVYGPLVLENTLLENKPPSNNPAYQAVIDLDSLEKTVDWAIDDVIEHINQSGQAAIPFDADAREILQMKSDLQEYLVTCKRRLSEYRNEIIRIRSTKYDQQWQHVIDDRTDKLTVKLEKYRDSMDRNISREMRDLSDHSKAQLSKEERAEKASKKAQKDIDDKKKNDREEKQDQNQDIDRAREEKERESKTVKPHAGGWQLQEYVGVSFEPTIARCDVKVQYVGGRHDEIDNSDSRISINVGVKVSPYKVMSDKITNALLDDYFSHTYQQVFKTAKRKIERFAIRQIERLIHKLTGKDVDVVGSSDPIKREILLAPQHGVDSSSFKRRFSSSGFYNFTAAIIVMNRDELKEIDSLFTDPTEFKKLLKMGWNSFCILDDIRERVYFISSMDGGYLHEIPYAYIFSTLHMDKTYETLDKLQKNTREFKDEGQKGFSAFAAKIMKENLLLSSMKRRLENEGNGS